MTAADAARLAILAAIWGGSFIFMRVAAPAIGAVWTAEGRVLIGGLAVLCWLKLTGFDGQWRRHWRLYAIIGLVNSAIPFTLFAFASIHLPASTMAFLNATAPMFGLLIGAAFGAERVAARKVAGLVLGSVGVALVARPEAGASAGAMFGVTVAACLFASFAYGLAGLLIKRWGAGAPSRGIAVGSQLAAAVALLPLMPISAPATLPSLLVAANLLALGLLASGLALMLYFRLVVDVGATRALTVTYLVPLFAFLWAAVFLGETLTAAIAAGGVLILAGTILVTRG